MTTSDEKQSGAEGTEFSVSISHIKISDGRDVEVDPDSVIVFVGPNNAGKTRALQDIYTHLSGLHPTPVVVHGVDVAKAGDEDAFIAWLDEHVAKQPGEVPEDQYHHPRGGSGTRSTLVSQWGNGPPFQQLTGMFCLLATVEERLTLASQTGGFIVGQQPPSSPLQVLFLTPELERRLSDISIAAFDMPIAMNRFAGANILLQVGRIEMPTDGQLTPEFFEAASLLPPVSGEGDGVRSFVGLMLAVISARYPMILIDEPEAFLHPPTARLLGRTLIEEGTGQVVVSTHSSDVLNGLLDEPNNRVTVIRLTKEGTVNPSAVLDPDRIRELWSDPLLRYSRTLDGLFHSGAVVCESDADCRFYEATVDALLTRAGRSPHDLLFTHGGGKYRIPMLVDALGAVRVPIAVIADIDLLRDWEVLSRIVEALGGSWSEYETDWRAVEGAVRQVAPTQPAVDTVRTPINDVLDDAGTRLGQNSADRIREIVKFDDGWSRLKRGGLGELPQGQPSAAGARILDQLEGIGLFVLPVGELERWAPDIPGHGPAWTTAALTAGVHLHEGDAAEFMRRVYDFLS